MENPEINYPVGTIFKEVGENYTEYYIVGEYFVYCNDYHSPQIRPWKFNTEGLVIANDEKDECIKSFKDNHLIWDEHLGIVEREYEEITLSVKVQVKPNTDVDNLIERLNLELGTPYDVYNMNFEKQ